MVSRNTEWEKMRFQGRESAAHVRYLTFLIFFTPDVNLFENSECTRKKRLVSARVLESDGGLIINNNMKT